MKRGYSNMTCGLIGEHLGHSFSPIIHAQIADYSYRLIELSEDQVGDFVKSTTLDAYNVTIPYKKTVMPYLDVISEEAQAIGAVNTIVRRDKKLYGYNTDYFGFSYMLDRSNIQVKGKKALVFGKGGASATVCAVLRDRGVSSLVTLASADNTPENIARNSDAQIIVNATPVGMYPKNGSSPADLCSFPDCEGVLDLIYNPSMPSLLLDAESKGIPFINGLAMLAAQAVRAFELFTGDTAEQGVCDRIIEKIEAQTKNVILIGMPGCGKSTVGRIVAKKLGRAFYDADQVFTQIYEKTPAEVIREDGEDAFRKMEHEVICILGKHSEAVIACGGGVVTRENNYAPLHQNGTIVFLQRELDKLSTKGRPLSQSASLTDLYQSRKDAYDSFADVKVKSTEIPEKTADLLITRLGINKEK